ncbi:MAG TPA: hypothetical protein VKM55_24305 [Candidatus Lokiarchaeia archaeon]|nr:hypothetical protein [Candidatus Lokiarchaeia archaeon]
MHNSASLEMLQKILSEILLSQAYREWSKAIDWCKRYLSYNPNDVDVWIECRYCYVQTMRF